MPPLDGHEEPSRRPSPILFNIDQRRADIPNRLYGIERRDVAASGPMPRRGFDHVSNEIKRIALSLKDTKDTNQKRELLMEMRRLLSEADDLLKPDTQK